MLKIILNILISFIVMTMFLYGVILVGNEIKVAGIASLNGYNLIIIALLLTNIAKLDFIMEDTNARCKTSQRRF